MGEIVLVVIGILLALQINNWNESRKEREIEKRYLVNILSDLKDQSASIEIQMENEHNYFQATSQIIKRYEEHHSLVLDSSFYRLATLIASRKTFIITDPTYTDLISSGNSNILKNIETKNSLIKYYQELERIEKIIQNNNTLLVDQNYIPVFNKVGYYFNSLSTLFPDISSLHEDMTLFKYDTKLEEISKSIMSEDQNRLALMNTMSLRNIVAIGNYKLLKEIQFNTKSLIEKVEKELIH